MSRIPTDRVAEIGRSVEVQRGMQGVGRMLRRGLHGAVNWVQEPEENGMHRTVGSKIFRVVVVLIPAWIVASAATGGPERGGQETGPSIFQAIVFAVLATVAGLAVFSTRERRQGREEPWNEKALAATKSGDSPAVATEDGSDEAATRVMGSPQVSEGVPSGDGVVTPSHISGVSDQRPHFDPEAATRPVALPGEGGLPEVMSNPFVQVSGGDRTDGFATRTETPLATPSENSPTNPLIPGGLEGEFPAVPLGGGDRGGHPGPVSLEKTGNPQVSAPMSVDTPAPSGQESDPWGAVTSSNEPDASTQTLDLGTGGLGEALFSQVGAPVGVATQLPFPVPAERGPFKVTEDPLSDDWWSTRPDVEPEGAAEGAAEGEPERGETEAATAPEAETGFATEGAPVEPLGLDPAVLMYLAMKSMPGATEQDREKARLGATNWARQEIEAGRHSQRTAATVLGVSKTTIGKWLGRDGFREYDPFADEEDE